MTTIEYKGYTIEPETDPWENKYGNKFKFYKGDIDCSFEDGRWTTNVRTCGSIEEAKELIDDNELFGISE